MWTTIKERHIIIHKSFRYILLSKCFRFRVLTFDKILVNIIYLLRGMLRATTVNSEQNVRLRSAV